MKQTPSKLSLSRETLRTLSAPEPAAADGRVRVENLPTTTVLTRFNTCTCL